MTSSRYGLFQLGNACATLEITKRTIVSAGVNL